LKFALAAETKGKSAVKIQKHALLTTERESAELKSETFRNE